MCSQIMSIFTSFNFKWPVSLVKLFNIASAATYNEQLMAPECSVSVWSFAFKYEACLGDMSCGLFNSAKLLTQ